MKKRLTHNLGLKLASLVLAFVLWFLVVQFVDPLDSVTFNNVKVNLINAELLEQEGKVYEVLDGTDDVRVTVYAPNSIIDQIRKTDVVAEADMSKLTDINTIGINYYVENVEVDIVEGSRDVMRLSIEEKSSKWIRLVGNTVGEVAEGFMIYSTSLDQTNIEITGPKSAVSQVEYAAVDMGVTGATTSLSANVDIQLYDAEDKPVESDNIKKNVNYAYMTVEVLDTKEVPVTVDYTGVPADGYLATGALDNSVTSVVLAGKTAVLDGINVVAVPGERLDITGATGNVVEVVDLKEYLPDSVKWADKNFDGKTIATVYVEPIVTREVQVPASNILVINAPEEFDVEFDETIESYELTISGLAEKVNLVQENAIAGFIDVEEYMDEMGIEELQRGAYDMPVVLNVSGDVSVESEIIVNVRFIIPEED